MSSLEIYYKGDQFLRVSPKFVYNESVYKIWDRGAVLLKETYYVSKAPMNLKRVQTSIIKEGFRIQRFIELESAPKEYLINKGYKRKKV